MKLSHSAAIVSFNRKDVEWAKYKNKQGGTVKQPLKLVL